MKKLIPLFLFVILAFVNYKNAIDITINAIPQPQEFGPNDWIKVNLEINGYSGGPIKWIAHRPDNSVVSGVVEQQVSGKIVVHQIIRDAFDKEFGPWTIDYQYRGVNQTAHFQVHPLNLRVLTDKEIYYEPDIMKINITADYYNPNAKLAQFYHLNFYDRDGNPAKNVREIEIRAIESSMVYNFPMSQLSRYDPPGLYKLKIQYFNSFVEVPFLLGDIHKLMQVSVQSNAATYYPGDNIIFNFIFTRVKESTGVITITDPSGNTTSKQFPVNSVHSTLVLKDISKKIGTYRFDIQYAGVKNTGTFKVVANTRELPKIDLGIFLDKLNYRRGEIVEAKVYASSIIADSITSWATDPKGISHELISMQVSSNNVIIPHKITKKDSVGMWKLYVNYGGIVRSSTFYVGGAISGDNELLNLEQFFTPVFLSNIGSNFNSPTAIAIDSDNNIYIADTGNSQIKKFDPNGNLVLTWGHLGSSKGEFIHPLGIFVNEKYVYVADTGNSRIQIFDKNGNFTYSWGSYGNERGMFHTPVSLSSDKSGNLFVADSELSAIQIFDLLGNYKDEIHSVLAGGESVFGIKAITFDSKNNFYVISTDNKILKYSGIGNFINFYGSNGTEEGRFNQPSAIVVDSDNYFYIADTGNHRIQKFDPNGKFIVSWGTRSEENHTDEPVGLAIDSLNNIYVVDKKQRIVQKFVMHNPPGEIMLPNWVKKNAIWWSEGALEKSDFALVVKYIIKQGLIHTPPTTGHNSITENVSVKIPEWIKKNVQLWSSGKIDDQTFFMSIEHLLSAGVMKI